jgi:hypothetical protein
MITLHHRPIKRFGLAGVIYDDIALTRLKNEYVRLVITEMRLSGYVPRLDISPDFTISFNYDKKYFEFILSVYGTFVGKKKSLWITGVDETRVVSTQQNRLSEFLKEVA